MNIVDVENYWIRLGQRHDSDEWAGELRLTGGLKREFLVAFGKLGAEEYGFGSLPVVRALEDVTQYGVRRASDQSKQLLREHGFSRFLVNIPEELPHAPSVTDNGPAPREKGK